MFDIISHFKELEYRQLKAGEAFEGPHSSVFIKTSSSLKEPLENFLVNIFGFGSEATSDDGLALCVQGGGSFQPGQLYRVNLTKMVFPLKCLEKAVLSRILSETTAG